MSDFVNTVDLIGEDALANGIIDGSITEIADDKVVLIGEYSFYKNASLRTVNFPNVKAIGSYAFQGNAALTEAHFAACETLGGSESFSGCSKLETIYFPKLTAIPYRAFAYCSVLAEAVFPSVTEISGATPFRNGTKLVKLDFPVLTAISAAQPFYGNGNLNTLILRSETMCTLSSATGLEHTGIPNGTGYIYVPRALLSDDDETKDYRRATNWSTYAAQFRALEDYTVDGTITGELDETKIAA